MRLSAVRLKKMIEQEYSGADVRKRKLKGMHKIYLGGWPEVKNVCWGSVEG